MSGPTSASPAPSRAGSIRLKSRRSAALRPLGLLVFSPKDKASSAVSTVQAFADDQVSNPLHTTSDTAAPYQNVRQRLMSISSVSTREASPGIQGPRFDGHKECHTSVTPLLQRRGSCLSSLSVSKDKIISVVSPGEQSPVQTVEIADTTAVDCTLPSERAQETAEHAQEPAVEHALPVQLPTEVPVTVDPPKPLEMPSPAPIRRGWFSYALSTDSPMPTPRASAEAQLSILSSHTNRTADTHDNAPVDAAVNTGAVPTLTITVDVENSTPYATLDQQPGSSSHPPAPSSAPNYMNSVPSPMETSASRFPLGSWFGRSSARTPDAHQSADPVAHSSSVGSGSGGVEEMSTVPNSSNTNEIADITSVEDQATTSTDTETSPRDQVEATIAPVDVAAPVTESSVDKEVSSAPVASASWWSYVWFSSKTPASDVQAPLSTDEHQAGSDEPSSDDKAAQDKAPAPQDVAISSIQEEASPPKVDTPPGETVASQQLSQTTDSLPAQSTSSWVPWGWYSQKPIADAPAADAGTSGCEKGPPAVNETLSDAIPAVVTSTATPSALSVSDTSSAAAAARALVTATTEDAQTAVVTALTDPSYSQGWARFFTSRTFTKTITVAGEAPQSDDVERDGNGAEVMNIDDDQSETASAKSENLPVASVPATPPGSPAKGKLLKADGNRNIPGSKVPPLLIANDVKQAARERTLSAPSSSGKGTSSANGMEAKTTTKEAVKVEGTRGHKGRQGSVSSLKSSSSSRTPSVTRRRPNLLLPTWQDTFETPPRNLHPHEEPTGIRKTIRFVKDVFFSSPLAEEVSTSADGSVGYFHGLGPTVDHANRKARRKERERQMADFGSRLPRAHSVVNPASVDKVESKAKRGKAAERDRKPGLKCVVIGIHGWFPGTMMRSVIGEPTGTSLKFVNMMVQALNDFADKAQEKDKDQSSTAPGDDTGVNDHRQSVGPKWTGHGIGFEKITEIPLDGEGTIGKRVEKLYASLLANESWMNDVHEADCIFVATHSQGCVVSTHLIDRLIRDGHVKTKTVPLQALGGSTLNGAKQSGATFKSSPQPNVQGICCLAMCGIHLGPLRYLKTSSLLQPYIQYFETAAARELFDFQDTDSDVSKAYVNALNNVVRHGVKMVYIASMNDQVVPLYSGLFTYASHPLILRAMYLDGDAYHSSDFLSNLLVLLLRVLNSGLSESGLLTHLSEATAGSLTGIGHSTAYEDLACYSLAVNYLFLTDEGHEQEFPDLYVEPFKATSELNDYEIPWALRDLIADDRVAYLFGREITELRDAFREWHPKTSILRDVKKKLQPITRLPSLRESSAVPASCKL